MTTHYFENRSRRARRIGLFVLAGLALAAMSRPAAAADPGPMFVKTPPAPVHDRWSGFYLGAHLGFGWGSKLWVDNFPVYDGEIDADANVQGILGGLQFGYNYQIDWLVLGAEGNFSWADINNEFNCYSFGDQVCSTTVRWLADISGRIGVVYGTALFYAKGGVIWVDDRFTNLATCAGSQPTRVNGISADCGTTYYAEQSRIGWLVGGGVEAYFARNWSVKIEYNYMNLGARNVLFESESGSYFTEEIHQRLQLVKMGFNYHFNSASQTVTALGMFGSPALAQANGQNGKSWVAFSGFDGSKDNYSAWAGALIAPFGDLDTSGWRVRILGEGGAYSYSVTGGSINGITTAGSVLGGYGFEGDNYSINLLAGATAINHMLSALDLTNSVEGTAVGATVHADARLNPTPTTLVYGEGEYTAAFRTYYVNAKFGIQLANITGLFIGPEASVLGDRHSNQWRVGGHLTEFTIGPVQVALSAGYAHDDSAGVSPYGHIEVSGTF